MTITLGYSQHSAPSAMRIADASDGQIEAVRRSRDIDVNWGRRTGHGLNPDTTHAVNKRLMRELFRDAGVPAPRLYTPEEALAALTDGAKLIGRPDFHTRGRGFWLCSTPDRWQIAMRGTRKKKPATHFVEFIDADHELRVHVFRGKSIRISEKKFADDRRDYTTIKPTLGRRRHVRDAAKQAVAALGLDFGAVDVLATNDAAWVLEVNTAPGLGGSMPRVWAQTFIDYFEEETT